MVHYKTVFLHQWAQDILHGARRCLFAFGAAGCPSPARFQYKHNLTLPPPSSSCDPGEWTEQGWEPLVFQMQGSSLPHCELWEEQARCEQKALERQRFFFSQSTSREDGKGAWRGSRPTSSVQLKGTSCSWALAGITMRKCAGVLNPIYWFSGSRKGLGICPLKEFPNDFDVHAENHPRMDEWNGLFLWHSDSCSGLSGIAFKANKSVLLGTLTARQISMCPSPNISQSF